MLWSKLPYVSIPIFWPRFASYTFLPCFLNMLHFQCSCVYVYYCPHPVWILSVIMAIFSDFKNIGFRIFQNQNLCQEIPKSWHFFPNIFPIRLKKKLNQNMFREILNKVFSLVQNFFSRIKPQIFKVHPIFIIC